MSKNETGSGKNIVPVPIIAQVIEFLTADGIRFHLFEENSLEFFMQAKNLTMRLVIYHYNSHLIFRAPTFIRNNDLNRSDVLMLMLKLMNEFLDIRFEIAEDGKSLSASCQHVLEDSTFTKKQFDFLMMIILHVVDETYPQFMKLLYSGNLPDEIVPVHNVTEDQIPGESSEESEQIEVENEDEDIKIN
jgi:hypothetical protein